MRNNDQDEVQAIGWHLTNTLPGHNKFYSIMVAEDGTLLLWWGKIATAGQSKVQKMSDFSDAKDLALRQFYAKATKGYEPSAKEFTFVVHRKWLNDAHAGNEGALRSAFDRSRRLPMFQGSQARVTEHYEQFATQARQLLAQAGTLPLDDALARYDELKEAWAALNDTHDEVETVVTLLKSSLHARVVSGGLA